MASFVSSVKRAFGALTLTLTGRKRRRNEQEGDNGLEPPVPESATRPRLSGRQLAPVIEVEDRRGPQRLDFSSPAVNLAAERGQAAVGGGGGLPHKERHEPVQPAAARRLDETLVKASDAGEAGGMPFAPPPALPSAAPFAKRFAPPTQQFASARTPQRPSATSNHFLLQGVRQVREAPASVDKWALQTPGPQRVQHVQQPPLGSVQGLFTGGRQLSGQQQQQRRQRGHTPAARRAWQQQQQRLRQGREGANGIELQPVGKLSRLGGAGAAAGQPSSGAAASQMEDAALLRQGVDILLQRQHRHERELEEQRRRRQAQSSGAAKVEEVDLTAEPSSSQQPPPALQQRAPPGRQQQWRQQHASADNVAAEVAVRAAPDARFDWREMLRRVATSQADDLEDVSSDLGPPGILSAEERYRHMVRESEQARRKALLADQQQVQCVQQAHTALERAQPQRAQRLEAEAERIQQELHDLQLRRRELPAPGPQMQPSVLDLEGQEQQHDKAVAEELGNEEDDDAIVLLSSDDEEIAVKLLPGTAPAGSKGEEPGVIEVMQRVAITEGMRLVVPDAWRDEYEQALAQGPPGEVLVDHPLSNIQLTRRDMACMAPLEWLNDEVINLYISLLLERDARRRKQGKGPRCHFFSTFFANKLYKDNGYNYGQVRRWTMPKKLRSAGQVSDSVLDVDRIVVPVHQGLHWVCAVADLQNRKLVYYDSLKGEDHRCLEYLARYLQDEYRNKRNEERDDILEWPREFPKRIPQQRNGCDCGVFTLLFASHAGCDAPMDFTQEDIDDWRVRIVHELLTLSVA